MSLTFGLFRLALSLGFFSCFDFDNYRGHQHRPLARAEADCACPGPVITFGNPCTQENDGLIRVGCDFNNVSQPISSKTVYTVEIRQTGKRDATLTWPKVTMPTHGRAMVSAATSDKAWAMSVHLRDVVGDKAVVEVGLTGRGSDGRVVNYKGSLESKVGAYNMTALGGHDIPEPLAISVCVKKAEHPAIVQVPMQHPLYPQQVMAENMIHSGTVSSMPAPIPVIPTFPPYSPVVMPHVMASPIMPTAVTAVPTQPCIQLAVATPAAKVFTLTKMAGKSKLSMKTVGMTSTSTQMAIDTSALGQVQLTAGKKAIRIKGADFTATADRVEVCGQEMRLCGNVKLSCEKIGVGAEVNAECLNVRLQNGHFVDFVKSVCPEQAYCPAGMCPFPGSATVVPNRGN
ncbi:MAG: hypothetical protein EBV06_08075 [Planctomycetia bacterium]|nr:hypothetical protein [Planctomycetia bacterium]